MKLILEEEFFKKTDDFSRPIALLFYQETVRL